MIKAGVNVYSMAFLLRLLERKERLINKLREVNGDLSRVISANKREIYTGERKWLVASLDVLN